VTARIGADDVDVFKSGRPDLLREISGLQPEPAGVHVLLDKAGVRSVQRLALADVGGSVVAAFWPAELKSQADYLYQAGRGATMVVAARECGWEVKASPHLAFFNSRPTQRLYMAPDIDAAEYASRWEDPDGRLIGQHPTDEVRRSLWPWLKERGYASDSDDHVVEQFFGILGRRNVHLRPGMRFQRGWPAESMRERAAFVTAVRRDVDDIFGSAGEPRLPASR
jgi:hypothetical protein